MAGKQVTKEEIARRQEHVARLLARRMNATQISKALTLLEMPSSYRTILRDIAEIRDAARIRAASMADVHLADELLQLEEIARSAAEQYAQTKDPRFLSEWRQTLARKAALLGLDAEIRAKLAAAMPPSGGEGDPIHHRLIVEYIADWRRVGRDG